MRTNSSVKKSAIAKLIGLVVIVLCFAIALSLTLGLDSNAMGIAEAERKSDRTTTETAGGTKGLLGGTSAYIPGDHGDLTAAHFNFPGTSMPADNTWTFVESIKKGGASLENTTFYSGIASNGGDDSIWLDYADTNFVTRFGTNSSGYLAPNKGYNWFFGATNYQTSNFIKALIDNSYFTVTVKATANIWLYDYQDWSINRDDDYYLGIKAASNGGFTAKNAYDERESAYFNHANKKWYSTSPVQVSASYDSKAITLTSSEPNIALAYGVNFCRVSSNRDMYMEIRDLKLTFSIKYIGGTDGAKILFNDGSAPVKVSEVFKNHGASWAEAGEVGSTSASTTFGGRVVEQYSPYTTDVTKMAVYYGAIEAQLARFKDTKLQTGDAILSSYTNVKKTTKDGYEYCKFASIEFADTYDYMSLGSADKFDASKGSDSYINTAGIVGYTYNKGWVQDDDNTRNTFIQNMASGIKSVDVRVEPSGNFKGDAEFTFNVYEGSKWQEVKVDDKTVGAIYLNKNGRANVTVEIYMNYNATVTLNVKDFGGSINSSGEIESSEGVTSITTFKGIDYEAPTAEVSDGKTQMVLDGFIANTKVANDKTDTDYTKIFWYKNEVLNTEASSGEEDDEENAPHLWFYSVQRATNIDAFLGLNEYRLSSFNNIRTLGMKPIAYGTLSSFSYDFKNGYAIANGFADEYAHVENINDEAVPEVSLGKKTGVGYYLFTFYKTDIAGNLGEIVTQYVKVDYEKPSYSLDFSYVLGGNTVKIDDVYASLANAQWALGEATLKINVSINFSGNSIRFEDADQEYMLTYDRAGNFAIYKTKAQLQSGQSGSKLTLPITTYLESTEIYFEYSITSYNTGIITVTFEGLDNDTQRYPTVAWMTGFNLTTVAYADMDAADNDESVLAADAKGEAKLFIDRHDPTTPEIMDDDDDNAFITPYNNYIYNANNAKWKTDNYNLSAILLFEDYVADIDLFAPYIHVYSAIKYVSSVSEFQNLKTSLNLENSYKNIKTSAQAQSMGINQFYDSTMNRLSNGSAPYPFEFLSGSGMRVIYTWVVDQAGRASQLYISYVLVDTENYTVSASMLEAIIGGNNFGANGTITADTRTAKRGDEISFDVAILKGYVPYMFNKNANSGNGTVNILINNSPNKSMSKSETNLAQFGTFALNTGEEDDDNDWYVIKYILDDSDSFVALNQEANFTMSARKVVTKVPSYNKYYDAQPLNMKDYVTLGDNRAKDYLEFRFFDSADDPIVRDDNLGPIDAGTYKIQIFIPENNRAFVLNYNATELAQGYQEISFTIIPVSITITPDATESVYGAEINLTYKISGFNFGDNNVIEATGEKIVGSLKLADAGWVGKNSMLNVGPYYIIAGTAFEVQTATGAHSNNFNVTFTANVIHTITQREVVINVLEESKEWGDTDKDVRFSVDPAQFGWYRDDLNVLLNTIFANYTASGRDNDLYLFNSNGRITRAKGENVGRYAYSVSGNIEVDGNYTVAISLVEKFFEITKRNIVLDVSGQYSVIKYGQTPDVSNVVLDYVLAGKDVVYADAIAAAIGELLNIDKNGQHISEATDEYASRYEYNIILGDGTSVTTDNMVITIDNNSIYIIYEALQGSVIVRLRDDVQFNYVYGRVTKADLTYDKLRSNFEVVAGDDEPLDFDDISWTVNIANDGNLNAGSYNIKISGASLVKNGTALGEYRVLVDTFTVKVLPANIVVEPVANGSMTKTYGQDDSVFGIGFRVVSVNDFAVNSNVGYAGFSYGALYNMVSGTFARGRYASNGILRNLGERYDDATDVYGNIDSEGDYYSFAVSTAFAVNSNNFSISVNLLTSEKFIINPKSIILAVENFVGVSKAFDQTDAVNFGSTVAYKFATGDLARNTDDLSLAFSAKYTSIGNMARITQVGIEFANLSLEGASAHNYVIGGIRNATRYIFADDRFRNKLMDGEIEVSGTDPVELTGNTKVVIFYIDNSITIDINDSNNHILINLGSISIRKDDFSLTKVYDGNANIFKENVSLAYRNDENGGSTMLYQYFESVAIQDNPRFQSADANSYLVNITLYFAIPGAFTDTVTIVKGNDPDIDVVADTKPEGDDIGNAGGVTVILRNLPATITQKVLGVESFSEITPVGQPYSGQGVIRETTVKLAEGAVIVGDEVNVTLVSVINDGNFNVGTHSVMFAAIDDQDYPSIVDNGNYTLDIEALNEAYKNDTAKTVVISKARLIPNVTFTGKEYDGKTEIAPSGKIDASDLEFVTEEFINELRAELELLTQNGTITYNLSANGKANANVVRDGSGKVIEHNILVEGVNITVSDAEKVLLSNYEFAGERYTQIADENGGEDQYEYQPVEIEGAGEVPAYELIGAVEITPKTVRLFSNNVIIKNKIYDGTNIADVKIVLDGSGVIEGEEEYIYVNATGTFTKSAVSDNIPVTIANVRLVAEEGYEELLNNYLLPNFTERRNASILPKPVSVVSVDLGEMTYNGGTQISNHTIKFDWDRHNGMIGNEADGYAVQTLPGYSFYINKNVERDGDVILAKEGTVFNPILRNSRGSVNYVLVIAETTKRENDTVAYYLDKNGEVHYGEPENDADVETYYYSLPIADKYIAVADVTNFSTIEQYVAGRFYISNVGEVYALDSSYTGNDATEMTALTYVKGMGKINPKAVTISASSIVVVNESAFTKMYDGTDHFFGQEGSQNGDQKDYYYRGGGISGVVGDDDVTVTGVEAKYESADTIANYVVFTPSGIKSQKEGCEDYKNYYVDGRIASARVRGKITKRPIDAYLEDGTVEYGTSVNTIVGTITYKVHGNGTGLYKLTEWESALYMKYDEYKTMMGGIELGDYHDALIDRIWTISKDEKGEMLGFVDVTEFVEANKGSYYIRLSGITSLPVAKASFNVSSPPADTSAVSYTLSNANVNNYEFVPVYTQGETSVLTVVKKDLFVATLGRAYSKTYAGDEPSVELYFLDKNGNVGFAPSENAFTVFVKNGENQAPVVKWAIYNTATKEVQELTDDEYKYALTNGDVRFGDDKVYLARFCAPNGVDYNEVAKNYNVHLGEGYKVLDDGTIVMVYGENYTLTTNASTLEISLPGMEEIALRNNGGEPYSFTYDGRQHIAETVTGTREGDEITIVTTDGEAFNVIDAGTYTGIVRVRREVKVDADDPNGYITTWVSGQAITINMLKASPQLKVTSTSKYYDGASYSYELTNPDNMISYLDGVEVLSNYAVITYEVLDGDEYVEVSEMRNAGLYRVSVTLNRNFENNNRNYFAETAVATYTILRSLVTVTISSEGYQEVADARSANGKTLVTAYDSEKESYEIKYTISNMAGTPAGFQLDKSQTAVVFEKEIVSAGIYPFSVQIQDGALDKNNYRLVNEIGVLELTTKTINNINASIGVETETVANRLVAKEIEKGKGNGSDIELWSKIDKHMPYIDPQARLESVIRLELYCDDTLIVYTDGNIKVNVAIPDNVGSLEGKALYTVTPEGGLKRLDNYTVEDGRIEYRTDYLSALVIVDLTPEAMPLWLLILIIVGSALVAITIIWTSVAYAIRKSQLKKLVK